MSVQNLKVFEVSRSQPEVAVIWAAAVGSALLIISVFKSANRGTRGVIIEFGLA